MPSELMQQVSVDSSVSAISPVINALLTTTSTAFAAATGCTPATFFLSGTSDINKMVAISIQEVDAGGLPVVPVGGFTLRLYRSIDDGFSYQVYKTYSAVTEDVETNFALQGVIYRFELAVKGANNLRVRVKSVR
jgi:hypothetical protein